MSRRQKRYPGEVDAVHPEPFNKIPVQISEKKDGQLTDAQLKQFFDEVVYNR